MRPPLSIVSTWTKSRAADFLWGDRGGNKSILQFSDADSHRLHSSSSHLQLCQAQAPLHGWGSDGKNATRRLRTMPGGKSWRNKEFEGGRRKTQGDSILGPPSEREPVDTDSNSLCLDCPPSHSPCKVANHFYSNKPTCALRLTQALVPAGFASTMSSYTSKISTRSIWS